VRRHLPATLEIRGCSMHRFEVRAELVFCREVAMTTQSRAARDITMSLSWRMRIGSIHRLDENQETGFKSSTMAFVVTCFRDYWPDL
jgi:hypothetical protein